MVTNGGQRAAGEDSHQRLSITVLQESEDGYCGIRGEVGAQMGSLAGEGEE
jgi:hypothetical protein